MATFKGNSGTVKVGSDAIAEIRSYSVDETMDTIEDTSMGDTYRTFKTSLKSFSGSVDVFFDVSRVFFIGDAELLYLFTLVLE